MKHVLIKDKLLEGKEYGTLRSFEEAVVKATGAATVDIPHHLLSSNYIKYFGHGMNRGSYRKFFPRQHFDVKADVAWYILMGPENYKLDLFKNWDTGCRKKILYLFDTLPAQYSLIRQLFSGGEWDLLITSFNDAVEDLQQLTGRKWYSAEQATDDAFYKMVPLSERGIHFSSYGRREPIFHEAVKEFCLANDFYYDYTTSESWEKGLDGRELYRQYAWHLNHSIFTFSWPVELTNPKRAGHLHPITCRWFEAASAGTVMVGRPPGNPVFEEVFFKDAVRPLLPATDRGAIYQQLETLWQNRASYSRYAAEMQQKYRHKWCWTERVQRILSWIEWQ